MCLKVLFLDSYLDPESEQLTILASEFKNILANNFPTDIISSVTPIGINRTKYYINVLYHSIICSFETIPISSSPYTTKCYRVQNMTSLDTICDSHMQGNAGVNTRGW